MLIRVKGAKLIDHDISSVCPVGSLMLPDVMGVYLLSLHQPFCSEHRLCVGFTNHNTGNNKYLLVLLDAKLANRYALSYSSIAYTETLSA